MLLNKEHRANLPLIALALPLFLENLIRSAQSLIDIFMLAQYNADAVAAVGLVATFSFFIMLLYSMVASGASVLISQYLGADRPRQAGDAVVASFVLGVMFSIILSLSLYFSAPVLLSMYQLETPVRVFALEYLGVWALGSIFVAFNIIQSTILRSYGHSMDTMAANMIATVVNLGGNFLALMGPEWYPFKGVPGVALSTVGGQAVAVIILAIRILTRKDIVVPWRDLIRIPWSIYTKLLYIGVPTAGENLSYNIMNILIYIPISYFGTASMNAHIYMNTVMRFVFMPALSSGVAAQIKTGYLVGAKQFDKAKKQMWSYYAYGLVISASIVIAVWFLRYIIFGIFTHDKIEIELISALILISFFREIGRTANVIIIPGLKGSGDTLFPVIIGIIFMWGIAAGGGILLGTVFGLGLIGIWIGMAADEVIRGIVMIRRWGSGVWYSARLVNEEE